MPAADANLIEKLIRYAAPLFVSITQSWAWLGFSLLCRIEYIAYFNVYTLRIRQQKTNQNVWFDVLGTIAPKDFVWILYSEHIESFDTLILHTRATVM